MDAEGRQGREARTTGAAVKRDCFGYSLALTVTLKLSLRLLRSARNDSAKRRGDARKDTGETPGKTREQRTGATPGKSTMQKRQGKTPKKTHGKTLKAR